MTFFRIRLLLFALAALGVLPNLRVARAAEEVLPTGIRSKVPELSRARQLIVVTTAEWDAVSARMLCFERADPKAPWKHAFPPWEAVIGRSGLAWGVGLHGTHSGTGRIKREGDGCAPAGVFALHEVFGYASPAEAKVMRFPYRQLTSSIAGVDDPRSRYYNRLVDSQTVADKDWSSAEEMRREDDLYRWGVVVEHNWKPYPGFGSCIFLHLWQASGKGTAGCTAMTASDMERVVRWLRRECLPVLVQLPAAEYARMKSQWMLPDVD